MIRCQVLQELTVKTQDGLKTIPPGKILTIRPEKAARLVELGKVIPIRPDQQTPAPALARYVDAFRSALSEVAIRDTQGEVVRRIRQDSPDTWAEIQAAEGEVNQLWKLAQGGRAVWAEYSAAVERWKQRFVRAIEGTS
jgi:hypothetical protein